MNQRLHDIFFNAFRSLRPLLLVVFVIGGLVASSFLTEAFVETPPVPLTKIASAPITDQHTKIAESDVVFKVSITGSVLKPGVYEVRSSSVVQDLITLAGGYTKSADLVYVSREMKLARQVISGEQIYIPSISEQKLLASTGSSNSSNSSSSNTASNNKVNLNTASISELDTLPGVGVSTAEKIIAARPYKTIEDIKNAPGIGDATYQKLKDLIEV